MRPELYPDKKLLLEHLKGGAGRVVGAVSLVAVMGFGVAEAAGAEDYVGGNPPELPATSTTIETPSSSSTLVPNKTTDTTIQAETGLPVTGGDVAGLTAIGVAAIATGLVLRHRSRRAG